MPPGTAQRLAEPVESELAATPAVFVVDDSYATRIAVAEILRDRGYLVYEAQCLREVDKLCRTVKSAPVLAVVDFVLPDGRGDQVAARLRQCWPQLFVLYFSGSPPDGDLALKAALSAPKTALLAKPTHLDAFEEAVQLHAGM